MSRKYCPLWQRGLSFGMRVMYCSGVWSYIVGALTAPTFIVIPLLTIWAGIFPIVISWWAALALTVYFIAQTAVLSYSKKFKHIESLWFAGIANNILWFTFVKACFRSLTTVFGAPSPSCSPGTRSCTDSVTMRGQSAESRLSNEHGHLKMVVDHGQHGRRHTPKLLACTRLTVARLAENDPHAVQARRSPSRPR